MKKLNRKNYLSVLQNKSVEDKNFSGNSPSKEVDQNPVNSLKTGRVNKHSGNFRILGQMTKLQDTRSKYKKDFSDIDLMRSAE